MFDWSQYKGNLPWLKDRTIYLTVSGSRAYGTHVEGVSDWDYRGIAVAPREYYLGVMNRFEQAECKDPDLTIFDLQKFIKLATDGNPNISEMLYTEPSDRLIVTPLGQRLIDNRDLFLSQKAKHTFSGYAYAQLKRIKESNFAERLKPAMHLVRLMTMCREILEEGVIRTRRPDAEFLLSIRNGAWSYDQLAAWAERQDSELTTLMSTSKLPKTPDRKKIDKLCVEMMEEALALQS